MADPIPSGYDPRAEEQSTQAKEKQLTGAAREREKLKGILSRNVLDELNAVRHLNQIGEFGLAVDVIKLLMAKNRTDIQSVQEQYPGNRDVLIDSIGHYLYHQIMAYSGQLAQYRDNTEAFAEFRAMIETTAKLVAASMRAVGAYSYALDVYQKIGIMDEYNDMIKEVSQAESKLAERDSEQIVKDEQIFDSALEEWDKAIESYDPVVTEEELLERIRTVVEEPA